MHTVRLVVVSFVEHNCAALPMLIDRCYAHDNTRSDEDDSITNKTRGGETISGTEGNSTAESDGDSLVGLQGRDCFAFDFSTANGADEDDDNADGNIGGKLHQRPGHRRQRSSSVVEAKQMQLQIQQQRERTAAHFLGLLVVLARGGTAGCSKSDSAADATPSAQLMIQQMLRSPSVLPQLMHLSLLRTASRYRAVRHTALALHQIVLTELLPPVVPPAHPLAAASPIPSHPGLALPVASLCSSLLQSASEQAQLVASHSLASRFVVNSSSNSNPIGVGACKFGGSGDAYAQGALAVDGVGMCRLFVRASLVRLMQAQQVLRRQRQQWYPQSTRASTAGFSNFDIDSTSTNKAEEVLGWHSQKQILRYLLPWLQCDGLLPMAPLSAHQAKRCVQLALGLASPTPAPLVPTRATAGDTNVDISGGMAGTSNTASELQLQLLPLLYRLSFELIGGCGDYAGTSSTSSAAGTAADAGFPGYTGPVGSSSSGQYHMGMDSIDGGASSSRRFVSDELTRVWRLLARRSSNAVQIVRFIVDVLSSSACTVAIPGAAKIQHTSSAATTSAAAAATASTAIAAEGMGGINAHLSTKKTVKPTSQATAEAAVGHELRHLHTCKMIVWCCAGSALEATVDTLAERLSFTAQRSTTPTRPAAQHVSSVEGSVGADHTVDCADYWGPSDLENELQLLPPDLEIPWTAQESAEMGDEKVKSMKSKRRRASMERQRRQQREQREREEQGQEGPLALVTRPACAVLLLAEVAHFAPQSPRPFQRWLPLLLHLGVSVWAQQLPEPLEAALTKEEEHLEQTMAVTTPTQNDPAAAIGSAMASAPSTAGLLAPGLHLRLPSALVASHCRLLLANLVQALGTHDSQANRGHPEEPALTGSGRVRVLGRMGGTDMAMRKGGTLVRLLTHGGHGHSHRHRFRSSEHRQHTGGEGAIGVMEGAEATLWARWWAEAEEATCGGQHRSTSTNITSRHLGNSESESCHLASWLVPALIDVLGIAVAITPTKMQHTSTPDDVSIPVRDSWAAHAADWAVRMTCSAHTQVRQLGRHCLRLYTETQQHHPSLLLPLPSVSSLSPTMLSPLQPRFDGRRCLQLLGSLHRSLCLKATDTRPHLQSLMTALTSIVRCMPPAKVLLYPQLVWVCAALLRLDEARLFTSALVLLTQYFEKVAVLLTPVGSSDGGDVPDYRSADADLLVEVLLMSRPASWDPQYAALQPLVMRGLMNGFDSVPAAATEDRHPCHGSTGAVGSTSCTSGGAAPGGICMLDGSVGVAQAHAVALLSRLAEWMHVPVQTSSDEQAGVDTVRHLLVEPAPTAMLMNTLAQLPWICSSHRSDCRTMHSRAGRGGPRAGVEAVTRQVMARRIANAWVAECSSGVHCGVSADKDGATVRQCSSELGECCSRISAAFTAYANHGHCSYGSIAQQPLRSNGVVVDGSGDGSDVLLTMASAALADYTNCLRRIHRLHNDDGGDGVYDHLVFSTLLQWLQMAQPSLSLSAPELSSSSAQSNRFAQVVLELLRLLLLHIDWPSPALTAATDTTCASIGDELLSLVSTYLDGPLWAQAVKVLEVLAAREQEQGGNAAKDGKHKTGTQQSAEKTAVASMEKRMQERQEPQPQQQKQEERQQEEEVEQEENTPSTANISGTHVSDGAVGGTPVLGMVAVAKLHVAVRRARKRAAARGEDAGHAV
jgi:hypothetical protein